MTRLLLSLCLTAGIVAGIACNSTRKDADASSHSDHRYTAPMLVRHAG